MTSEVTQADRKAIDRAEAFAKSKHTTPDEHDDIMVAVRLARLTAQSGEGRSGAGEPWPGCYADLHERRVTTLAKLGIMLSLMVRGESWLEAVEAVGYETSELHAEVLMALAIEDADDTDIALEEARDHPEHDCLAALNARQSGEGEREALRREIINTPETADFMAGVPIEAAHQRERWGADHDAGKTPFDWFWLIGYLAQKAATSAVNGNIDKALHHTISTAAALANWHAALSGADTAMRPGIAPPASLDEAALRATDDAGGAK